MRTEKLKIGVLGSTRGTSLQGVIDAIREGRLDAEVVLVVSDRANAPILERARLQNVPELFIDPKARPREEFEREMTAAFHAAGAEILLMIGFMRIVSPEFVNEWRGCLCPVLRAMPRRKSSR